MTFDTRKKITGAKQSSMNTCFPRGKLGPGALNFETTGLCLLGCWSITT